MKKFNYIVISILLLTSCVGNNSSLKFQLDTVKSFPILVDQLGDTIARDYPNGKVRIQDFFFTRCSTICPKIKKNLKSVYVDFQEFHDQIEILSISIDQERDSVQVLNRYANRLGVKHSVWKFASGKQSDVQEYGNSLLAEINYDSTVVDGILHSGAVTVFDKTGEVREVFDGTKKEDIERLKKLLKELLLNE